jgi:hypothetical protein
MAQTGGDVVGKKKENAKAATFHARMTVEQAAKLEKLGGAKWLRDALDAADARTDDEVLQEGDNELSGQEWAAQYERDRAAFLAECEAARVRPSGRG